jgi:hypothetical protein
MNRKYERWAATGTAAVVVAVAAATWAMAENLIEWRNTFRLERLASARGADDDFEVYRSGWIGESAAVWVAVTVLVLAVIVVTVAGVRARRWPPIRAAFGAHMVLPDVVLVAALTLRDFARPAPQSDEAGVVS